MELLNFPTGTRLNSPSKHTHADTKTRFFQTNNCFLTLKEKHPYSSGTWYYRESLFFQSWTFIHPTTNNDHLTSISFWTSLFSLSPIQPLFLRFGPISSWAIPSPGLEIIYWQLLHSIHYCQQQAGAGAQREAVCYSCHKVQNVEELLHGGRSVSEAGWWAAPAASCLCDLTVCVNQERVSARPASLISISLQITPRRQSEGGEL